MKACIGGIVPSITKSHTQSGGNAILSDARKLRKPRRIARWSEVEFPFVLPKGRDAAVVIKEGVSADPQIGTGTVVAEIALFDYEIASLRDVINFIEIEKDITDLLHVDEQITALDNSITPFFDWSSAEIAEPKSRAIPTAQS